MDWNSLYLIANYWALAGWLLLAFAPRGPRILSAILYAGVALYKVGTPSASEPAWTVDDGVPELKRQLDLNESLPGMGGTILFRQRNLTEPQTDKAVEYLRTRWKTGQ